MFIRRSVLSDVTLGCRVLCLLFVLLWFCHDDKNDDIDDSEEGDDGDDDTFIR